MLFSNLSFSNQKYAALPANDFVWGNVGDEMTFSLDFELQTAGAGFADFYFNLIPNSRAVYSGVLDFSINNDLFKNLHSQTVQSFKGALPTVNGATSPLNPANPANYFVGTMLIRAINVALRQYRIESNFAILPLLRLQDLNGNTFSTPSWLSGNESLKAIFKLQTKANAISTAIIENSENDNFSSLYKSGNVGFLNEKLNGLSADFEFVAGSAIWQNGLSNLDSTQISKVKFKLKKVNGNFATNTAITLRATTPNDTFGNDTYSVTQNYDFANVLCNGTTANGVNNKLIACKATVNGGNASIADVEVSFAVGSYQNLALFAAVYHNTTTNDFNAYESNNVWVLYTETSAQLNNPVTLQNLGDARNSLSFLYHYDNDAATQSFNHIIGGFVHDWFQALTKIVPSAGAIIQQIRLQVKRKNGTVLDNIINTNVSSLPIAQQRPFKLLSGDYRQEINISKVGNNFEVKAGFKTRPEWFSLADVVFAVIVNGSQNNLPFEKYFLSPVFVKQTYELSLNNNNEPKALGYTIPTTSKKIFVDGNEVGKIMLGRKNTIRFFFRDDNLNDLQATLPDLVAYFTVNLPNEPFATQHSIHSEWDKNPDSPWEEVPGHTAGRVKIVIVDIKEAYIEAVLDATKLVAIYGRQKLSIAGRLDKRQPPEYLERILMHLRGNNPNDTNFRPYLQLVNGLSAFEIIYIFDSIVSGSMLYKYSEDINPNWVLIPAVSYDNVITQIGLGTGNGRLLPYPVIDSNFTEATIILQYYKEGIAPATSWTYNFANTNSIYVLAGFETKFTVLSAVGQADVSFKIRTDGNVNFNTINATDYAGFLANLAALPIETPFEVMLINFAKTLFTITYNY